MNGFGPCHGTCSRQGAKLCGKGSTRPVGVDSSQPPSSSPSLTFISSRKISRNGDDFRIIRSARKKFKLLTVERLTDDWGWELCWVPNCSVYHGIRQAVRV